MTGARNLREDVCFFSTIRHHCSSRPFSSIVGCCSARQQFGRQTDRALAPLAALGSSLTLVPPHSRLPRCLSKRLFTCHRATALSAPSVLSAGLFSNQYTRS
jgi:hypothetical protein